MMFISLMLLSRCIKLFEHVGFLYVFSHQVCHVSWINSLGIFLLNLFFTRLHNVATQERIHMDLILRTVNMLLRFVIYCLVARCAVVTSGLWLYFRWHQICQVCTAGNMEKITNLTPMYPLIIFLLPLIICMVILTWENVLFFRVLYWNFISPSYSSRSM